MTTRRRARENAFLAMFEYSFGGAMEEIIATGRENEEYAVDAFGEGLLMQYRRHAEEVDGDIESKLAKGWKVSRLSRTNLAVLRLAVTEMHYTETEDDVDSIVINEAVELAKKYASDEDYQFVNGVLGSLSRQWAAKKAPETPAAEKE